MPKFQFQQGVLAVVHIHGVNLRRPVQQVVQGVAPGAGDHHHPAGRIQFHQLAVNARILPTGVVDELAAVHMVKHEIAGGFEKLAGQVPPAVVGFGRDHHGRRVKGFLFPVESGKRCGRFINIFKPHICQNRRPDTTTLG